MAWDDEATPRPTSAVAERDVEAQLARYQALSGLRFITCGSVDDGKSTLIGRLLWNAQAILEDQARALVADSRRAGGGTGEGDDAIDFSLLLDGLVAEREQGITIDVAYRFFATDKRRFIVADTPGHEQYTRNMVTAASTADLAVILVDARKGVLTQTRRHSFLVSLMGVRHAVLAVNKMDLVGYDQTVFDRVVADYRAFAAKLGFDAVAAIPLSGLRGDNVTKASEAMPWYAGPTLLEHLETATVDAQSLSRPWRFPVQGVSRPHLDFRGFTGQVSAGVVRAGDAVRVLPSGRTSTVARIVTADGDLPAAVAGRSVTLTLTDEVDVSRGDVLAIADDPPEISDQFEVDLVWMDQAPLLPGRAYWLKLGPKLVGAKITAIKHRVDVDTLEPMAAKSLALNEIALCNLSTDEPIAFEPYARSAQGGGPELGGFVLIDRASDATAGVGMIRFALRRAANVHWQALDLSKATRAAAMGQAPAVVWFTGLSGSGKSSIANRVEAMLHAQGRYTYTLDGDNVRHGLNRDLGFTDADRVENIRRVAETAKLMADAGLIVLVSFISPFRAERDMARALMDSGEFLEVFVDTPLEVAEARDVKGLYRKARAGDLKNFTGIDSPYEAPASPELRLDTTAMTADAAAERVVALIMGR